MNLVSGILVAGSLFFGGACGKDKDAGEEEFKMPSKQEMQEQAIKIILDAEDGIEVAKLEVHEAFTALEAAATDEEKTAARTRIEKAREDLKVRQAGLRSIQEAPGFNNSGRKRRRGVDHSDRPNRCAKSSDPLCGL